MTSWRRFALAVLLALGAAFAGAAHAHEVRPGYPELSERADGGLHILWKQPVAGAYGAPLVPEISANGASTGWVSAEPARTDSFLASPARCRK